MVTRNKREKIGFKNTNIPYKPIKKPEKHVFDNFFFF